MVPRKNERLMRLETQSSDLPVNAGVSKLEIPQVTTLNVKGVGLLTNKVMELKN